MPADWTSLGLVVGHATDLAGATGLTVVRGSDAPFRAAVAVLGRATGTRELDTLAPHHVADRCDAILLTGGSAYGLDAAAGVMRWMEERGRGFPAGPGVVPIVPAAVVFDLAPLGDFAARPTAEMAYAACDGARATPVEEGSVGAGTGATLGKGLGAPYAMKGGLGCWTGRAGALAVGALAVVNAVGDVRDAAGRIIAGARRGGAFLDVERSLRGGRAGAGAFDEVAAEGAARGAVHDAPPDATGAAHHTTLALVATNAGLSRVALSRLAAAAGAALARRITPVGTSFDGDVIFAACPLAGGEAAAPLQVEALATHALEMAVERAVRLARGRDGVPGLADEGLADPRRPG